MKEDQTVEEIKDIEVIDNDLYEFGENDYYYPELYDDHASLRRNNVLIRARYKATALETKILFLTMYRCQQNQTRRVSFTTFDLKVLLRLEDRNTYTYSLLKSVASNLIDHKFYIEEGKSKWGFYSFLESAEYENGTMRLTLSEPAYKHLTVLQLQSGYTSMNMPLLLSIGTSGKKNLRQNYTIRLYEMMKLNLFHVTQARPRYRFKHSLNDVRISIGIVDPSDPGIKEALMKGTNLSAEIDRYVAKKESHSFSRWTDLERRVLRVAQEDINANTDVYMEFSPIKVGRGGKVTEVCFTISRNPNYKGSAVTERKPDITLVEKVSEITEGKVRVKTILKLLSEAGNDIERIRKAMCLANAQKSPIQNLSGFLIKAIREEWAWDDTVNNIPTKYAMIKDLSKALQSTEKERKTKIVKDKNPFNNFEQNVYDFEQLEFELLKN